MVTGAASFVAVADGKVQSICADVEVTAENVGAVPAAGNEYALAGYVMVTELVSVPPAYEIPDSDSDAVAVWLDP